MKDYINITDKELAFYETLEGKYKKLYEDPENCEPLIIVGVPTENKSTWEEKLEYPELMLKAELDRLKAHLEVGDDYLFSARVNFGTAQIAAAFGCEIIIPENNLPAAGTHVLQNLEDVYKLKKPTFDAGWIPKLKQFTEFYLENIPIGLHIQHPDIQSAFNSAHLIRGNDILMDFYDDPEALGVLLDKVTDFMLDFVKLVKEPISNDKEWFYDAGGIWKGAARISNCTMQLISPNTYKEFVLPRDIRLMEAIGGGRVHYCGSHGAVIDEFFENPSVNALELDLQYHDIVEISDKAPKNMAIMFCDWAIDPENGPWLNKLYQGNWPKKKNIVIYGKARSIQEGRSIYKRLKQSIKYQGE